MRRLIKAEAPNFNNYETYTYFCVAVLPNIFEKLRQEKRLVLSTDEIEYSADKRKYTGELCNGEPTGNGTSIGSSGATYMGAWLNGLPHGLVTLSFVDGQVWAGEMKANRIFGKRTNYYPKGWVDGNDHFPNGKVLNSLDKKDRYKYMKEIHSNEEAFYK